MSLTKVFVVRLYAHVTSHFLLETRLVRQSLASYISRHAQHTEPGGSLYELGPQSPGPKRIVDVG